MVKAYYRFETKEKYSELLILTTLSLWMGSEDPGSSPLFAWQKREQSRKNMDIKGFEPLTFSMQSRRSTTDLNALAR
jgi:hypothetical protein